MDLRKILVLAALVVGGFAGLSAMAGSAEAATSRNCKPTAIAIFNNRIHLKCAVIKSQAYTEDIPYYAMSVETAGSNTTCVLSRWLVGASMRSSIPGNTAFRARSEFLSR